jgi:hypothetical protein
MSEKWFDYRNRTVTFNTQEGKWAFGGRLYKREGQAHKAAWKFWRKHND